ncbi:MAG: cadherin-like beta sandwich domain-containing protein, partial [Lachnospira sp.]|nr:cadherin-like beta sandwich domain-containing protein [Lachnospira sp.]
MKKRVAAFLLICVVVLGLTTLSPDNVYADGTVNISVSSTSGIVGDEVTVEVKATSDKKFYSDLSLSYDASVLQLLKVIHGGEEIEYGGGGGTVRIVKESAVKSATWSIKFKMSKVGSSTVKVLGNSLFLDEEEGKLTTAGGSGNVTVKAPVNYSADNTLKSLQISPGKLTPDFSPDVTEYKVSVDASCYKLTVNAVANDAKAKVGVAGTSIKEGDNKTVVTVTAENGSKKTYTIIVNKGVSAPQSPTPGDMKMCEYNGEHYFINEDYTLNLLPSGFERYEINYKGETMCVGKNAGGLSIMYLEHTVTGVGSFFVYDTVKERFSPFIMVDQAEAEFIILDITDEMEKPLGFELVETEIAEQSVKAMKSGESEFYLFYGMNSKGTTGWYSYDSKEGTIQRYSGVAPSIGNSQDGVNDEENDGENNSKGGMWKDIAIAAIIVACAMLLLALISM